MADAAAVVKEWASRLDAGDLDGSSDLVAEDIEWANPVAVVHGREQLRALLGVFWTAIPDFQHEIADSVSSGTLVAIRGTASGTHTGPLAGPAGEIPASGASISFPFSAWARNASYHFPSHLCNKALFQFGDMFWTRRPASSRSVMS